jgi:hypothetical protein
MYLLPLSSSQMMEGADSSGTAVHFYHTTWHHTAQDNNLIRLQISNITDALVCNDITDGSKTDIRKHLELFDGECHIVTEENAKYACATSHVHSIRVQKWLCLGEES